MDFDFRQTAAKITKRWKAFANLLGTRFARIEFPGRNSKIIITVFGTVLVMALLIALSWDRGREQDAGNHTGDLIEKLAKGAFSATPSAAPEKSVQPAVEAKQLPVIDLSDKRMEVKSSMLRIDSPTPWGRELVYSAGNAVTIDEPVLVDLYLYNMDTGMEVKAAQTRIPFGEIYEGRLNQDYIVWLDTNQRGTNIIYSLNRTTNEIRQIKKSEYTHPQLRLFGDNLVWVEQMDEKEDRLYLYNLKSGEPVVLETFNIPSYGTCPPSIYNDVVVWVYPSPGDPNKSIIKRLDLREALSMPSPDPMTSSGDPADDPAGTGAPSTGTAGDDPNRIDMEVVRTEAPEGNPKENDVGGISEDAQSQEGNPDSNSRKAEEGSESTEEGFEEETGGTMDTRIIEPHGFAIYPSTNGQAVAWLDNLNPSLATLKLTLDDGKEIINVAKDVGRIFGVGESFVAYMQEEAIILYFWEENRYARLTAGGEAGRLSGVAGNTVAWYDANDPSRAQDKVIVSEIDASMLQNN